jgi:hypothetical protein
MVFFGHYQSNAISLFSHCEEHSDVPAHEVLCYSTQAWQSWLARNAISLAAQPPLSYPCSDKLPFNLRTWPGLQTAKIGLNATLVAGTLQLIYRVPNKCSDSRLTKSSSGPK